MKKAKNRYLNDKIKQCCNSNSRQWWKEVKSLVGMNNNHQMSSILLMLIIHNWFQALDGTGSLIRICLFDFPKEFDKIDHNFLINKLRNMNIRPVIVNWIIAFLSGRYQRIKLNECTSSLIDVNAGVPQGTKLGPLLFLIMINNFKPTNNIIKFLMILQFTKSSNTI